MVTLVTGCRSGFGLGIAVEAARRGHTVYAGLRDLATKDELVARSTGLDVRPVQLDVTDKDQREAAVARILDEHGRIDGLVNNAGVVLGGFLELLTEEELRKVFDVNVFGVWAMTCAVLPAMRTQRAGKLIMLSSVSGIMALPGLGAYASSKFALEGMSESWRHELRPFDIDVYLVEPGPYRTDIWGRNRTLADTDADGGPYGEISARVEERLMAMVQQSMREPDEVITRIMTLLEGPRTRLRHPMGPGAVERKLAKLLPFSVTERGVRKKLME